MLSTEIFCDLNAKKSLKINSGVKYFYLLKPILLGVLKKSYILREYISVFYSGDTRPPSMRVYKVIA